MTQAAPASMPRDGDPQRSPTRHFVVGLARAVAGAILFGLPLHMTMEMWALGVTMDGRRLALLLALTVPLLVGLSHVSGYEETFGVRDDLVDACVALAVGFAVGAGALTLFGVLHDGVALTEALGKVALQAVPGSMGALLAQSILGQNGAQGAAQEGAPGDGAEARGRDRRPMTYATQLFLMAAGALFLAFNIAPTEEMLRISYMMSPWHVLALIATSLLIIHAFVYALEFTGQEPIPPGTPFWSVFLRFTVVGYALALLICAYVLWSFGRLDDTSWADRLPTILVLGLPASVGAAAARLIL